MAETKEQALLAVGMKCAATLKEFDINRLKVMIRPF